MQAYLSFMKNRTKRRLVQNETKVNLTKYSILILALRFTSKVVVQLGGEKCRDSSTAERLLLEERTWLAQDEKREQINEA